jgi:hypothetical protein
MQVDDKISFATGWLFTTASTLTAMGMIKAAALGLIGGFFGLAGKEIYYFIKAEIKKRKDETID